MDLMIQRSATNVPFTLRVFTQSQTYFAKANRAALPNSFSMPQSGE
jgi:hypothetical protein